MDFVHESAFLLLSGAFILGALVGSFLNVVILRVPPLLEYNWRCQCRELLEAEGEAQEPPPGIVTGRSKCQDCGHQIRAWENIPLASYVFLKGKCASCKKRISIRYPATELATAILYTITIWHFGPTIQGGSALIITAFLIALTCIDFDHQLLPDNFTLPLMWGGILLSIWSVHTDLVSSVTGAAVGYLILWSIYHLFHLLTGKEGMGYGDFKLLAALGAWLGWQILPLVILFSSIAGAATGIALMATGQLEKDKPMPFGPFIAMAGWIALIWGDLFVDTYFGISAFG